MSSKSTSIAQDQRVQLETTGGGQFVAPEARVAQDQAVLFDTAGSYKSSVTYAPTSTYSFDAASFQSGLTGAEIQGIMEQQADVVRTSADAAQRMAELSLSSVTQAAQGQSIDWRQYIPIAIVGVIAIAAFRGRRT